MIFVKGCKHSVGKKGQKSLPSMWVSVGIRWRSMIRPLRMLYLNATQAYTVSMC